MGSNKSQEASIFENNYMKQTFIDHPFFGNHTVLINPNQQILIHKQIVFQSSSDYDQYLSEYEKIEKKPFNIIYPKILFKEGFFSNCSNIYQINVYFESIGRSLTEVIRNQGCFNQSKAWFLLNQISKSLQLLSELHRPHWAISPQNIFQNSYQNYFIYDSFFVLGFAVQSFLTKILENNELMSQKMKFYMLKGITVGTPEGFEEDCYCLGFVLLFALTGIHPKNLPHDCNERTTAVNRILNKSNSALSVELKNVILQLTEKDSLRRMDNYQLRRLLKDKQMQIIKNEEHQYQRSRRVFVKTERETFKQKLGLSRQQPISSNRKSISQTQQEEFPKLTNQIQSIGTHQKSSPINIKYPLFTEFSANRSNPQHFNFPFNSNTLTRISSDDRLISKR